MSEVPLHTYQYGRHVQGSLGHKKQPTHPRTTIGPWALSYCRVLGGDIFSQARYLCMHTLVFGALVLCIKPTSSLPEPQIPS
jgi:hypothetical protein